nr:ROK family protein [Rhodomicrobium vannielii]
MAQELPQGSGRRRAGGRGVTPWRLIADVGGTNVRFARVFDGLVVAERRAYQGARFESFIHAMRVYAAETGGLAGCASVAIGAAGPVAADEIHLTNIAWTIRVAEVEAEVGAPCTLLNDVEAAAYGALTLTEPDYALLSGLAPDLSRARRLLIANIGTGFGAAALFKVANVWISCPSEAGHMSLRLPDDAAASLRSAFPSVEHALSGRGLVHLHAALSGRDDGLSARDICANAAYDPAAAATIRLFAEITGSVLGDLTLAYTAWDGVFLVGSVAKGCAATDPRAMRAAFENKGPMSNRLKAVPVALMLKEDPAFFGLAIAPVRTR